MSSTRSNSLTKSATAHSSLNRVTYGGPTWADEPQRHGLHTVKWSARSEKFFVKVNFMGRVYSGVAETEGLALSAALSRAAELNGLLSSDVMNAWFKGGDEADSAAFDFEEVV